MITEDEVMRLLERADPARRSHTIPDADAAGYLAAMRTRSTTVTLIDTEPTSNRPKHRHLWPIIAAAAAVVAIVVGGLVLATRDDDPNEQIPAATTVAPDPDASAAEAEEVARGFVDAYVTGDGDRAFTHLADQLIATDEQWRSPEALRRHIAWEEAARYKWNVHDCQRRDAGTEDPQSLDDPAPAGSGQPIGTTVQCGVDFHALGSDALGLGPYDISWDLIVRDGKVVSAGGPSEEWNWTPQFDAELWGGSFANWIRTEHPDDVLVMYQNSSQDRPQMTDEALRLWEQRTEQFVQAVLTGPETYAADVAAVCADQAAQLAEIAEPAEGAADQVAAWSAAASAIMVETHGELIALVKPPMVDSAYSTFYGRLFRLARIAEQSGAAATAGDSTGLTELNAEYLDVRESMSSGPAGTGLEQCVTSLQS